MKANVWMLACAVMGAGLSAQGADGLIFRTARNLDLAPAVEEEEVALDAPPEAAGPLQGPGQAPEAVPKGDVIQAMPGDYGSACTDRRYFSWLGGGCCERQPSCCDNVWEGYCAQRHLWCHKCKKAHGCAQRQTCNSCDAGGKWAYGGLRHHEKASCDACGGGGLGLGHFGLQHGGKHCKSCNDCGHGHGGWNAWRPFGGYFETMWNGSPECATCGNGGHVQAGASYLPAGESVLTPQPIPPTPAPEPEMDLKPEPVKERAAAQQRLFPPLGFGLFQ